MDKIRTGVKKEQCVETSSQRQQASRDTKKNNRPNIPCRSVCKLMKFRTENAAPLSLLNKGNVLQESWHTTEWMKTKNYDRKKCVENLCFDYDEYFVFLFLSLSPLLLLLTENEIGETPLNSLLSLFLFLFVVLWECVRWTKKGVIMCVRSSVDKKNLFNLQAERPPKNHHQQQ